MIGRLLLVFAVLHGVLMIQMTSNMFFKVASEFCAFKNPTPCLIESKTRRSTVKSECLTSCDMIKNCRLTCFNGTTCLFYSSFVSKYWDPSTCESRSQQKLPGLACYSSHHLHGDITDKVATSSAVNVESIARYAIDGYLCGSLPPYYRSEPTSNPWIELGFDRPYHIREVILHPYASNPLERVEIRVGSVKGVNGDFTGQTFFDYFEGPSSGTDVVSFRADVPIKGKFVSLKVIGDTYAQRLYIVEMKVLV